MMRPAFKFWACAMTHPTDPIYDIVFVNELTNEQLTAIERALADERARRSSEKKEVT